MTRTKVSRLLRATLIVVVSCLILISCARSKDPELYVLYPVIAPFKSKSTFQSLRIGLNGVNIPTYLNKPEIAINSNLNQLSLLKNKQWAEALDQNINRVLVANLSVLLPRAAVAVSPWAPEYSPNANIQVNIIDLSVNNQGMSKLRAQYFIFRKNRLIRKQHVYYSLKIHSLSPLTFVKSINENINHLSRDIAKSLRRPGKQEL